MALAAISFRISCVSVTSMRKRRTFSLGSNSDNLLISRAVAITLSPRATIAETNNFPRPELHPVRNQTRDDRAWVIVSGFWERKPNPVRFPSPASSVLKTWEKRRAGVNEKDIIPSPIMLKVFIDYRIQSFRLNANNQTSV